MPTKTSEVASVSVLESTDYLLGINYTGGSPVATIRIQPADLFAAPPAIGGTTPAAVTGTTITATTGFVGDVTGDVTGDLTGDVTGNVTGDVVGNVTGDVTGNADTATALATARTINGVSFDGTANITVTAAAGTLTGTTLASNVVTSSLTAVGTIATGVWQGTAIDSAYIDPTLSVTTLTVSGATTLNGVTYTWPASLGNAGDRLQLGASGALTWVAPTAAASAEFVTLTVTSGADFSGATISDLGTVTTVVINGGTITGITDLAVADGGTGASTASAARTNLGLGSIATQDANAVAVTGGTIDGTTQASGTINGPIAVGGTWTAAATWTLPAFTLGGTVSSNGQSFSGTIANLGSVTTVDINGGSIDGAVIGAVSAAAITGTTGTFTSTLSAASIQSTPIGSVTPSTGAFTTLSATGTTNLPQTEFNSATANRVATFTSTDATAYISFVDDTTTNDAYVYVGAVGDSLNLRGGNAVLASLGGVGTDYLLLGATATSSNAQFYATKGYSAASGTDSGALFTYTQDTDTTGNLRGLTVNANTSTATFTGGAILVGRFAANHAAAGTIASAGALDLSIEETGTGTITTAKILRLQATAGSVTSSFAIYQEGASDVNYLAGALRIGTTAATSAADEVLRLSSATGTKLLNVHRTDSEQAFAWFTNSTTGTTATDGFVVGINSSEQGLIWNYESNAVLLGTANTERLRISGSGPVLGVGTNDLEGWSTSYGVIEFGQSAIMAGNSDSTLRLFSNAYFDGAYKYKAANAAVHLQLSGGQYIFNTAVSGAENAAITWAQKLLVSNAGNVVVGSAALATTATDGFLCITSMPGAPTGTPTAYTGRPPIVWDSTNDLLKLYDGAWLTIGGPTKRGACYMTTPAATTISVAGTYYKAAGTTTGNNLAGFLSSTSNRLTYNGPGTVHVHVAASASLTSAGSGVVVGMRLAKNGDATTTDAVATTARAKITTGTDIGDHAVHGDFELSNGDYIELFVTNETNTNTVTVDNLYLFAMAMATS